MRAFPLLLLTRRHVAQDEPAAAMVLWRPWWEQGVGASAVNVPFDASAIPPFATLCVGEPSPLLPLVVIDMLFAYAYTCRRCNGDHMGGQGAPLLLQLCASLDGSAARPCASLEEWHTRAAERASACTLGAQSATQTRLAFRDTAALCRHASHVSRALWETHAVLVAARPRSRAGALAAKKALFFLSWAVSTRPVLVALADALDAILSRDA